MPPGGCSCEHQLEEPQKVDGMSSAPSEDRVPPFPFQWELRPVPCATDAHRCAWPEAPSSLAWPISGTPLILAQRERKTLLAKWGTLPAL